MSKALGVLRAMVRLPLLLLVILLLAVSWIFPPLVGLFSRRAQALMRIRQMRWWARSSLFILNAKVTVEGPVPSEPGLIVSNHMTYLDIMVLWTRLDAYFLAKMELGSWPGLGVLIRAAGTLFIDRDRARGVLPAIEAVQGKLELGCGVIIFAEGTSSSGEDLLPLRSNLFEVAARTGYPVRVACLHYATDDPRHPPREHVAWWGDMGFVDHFLRLLTIRSIRARVRYAPDELRGDERKALCADAERVMRGLFEPTPASEA